MSNRRDTRFTILSRDWMAEAPTLGAAIRLANEYVQSWKQCGYTVHVHIYNCHGKEVTI